MGKNGGENSTAADAMVTAQYPRWSAMAPHLNVKSIFVLSAFRGLRIAAMASAFSYVKNGGTQQGGT